MIMAPALRAQEKTDNNSPKEKLTALGTMAGKISKLAKNKGSFTLKVSRVVPYTKSSTSSKKPSAGMRQKKVNETLELQLADGAVVRLMENGKPSDSSRQDLRKGQVVEVAVVKNRLGEHIVTSIVIYP
jgi:hypothetical protein